MPATAATRVQQADQHAEPDGHLAQGDDHAHRRGDGHQVARSGAWMGLERAAPTSWAWIEVGLAFLRNWGLASFWSPAKRKVTPRKSRRGRRTQPVATVPSGRVTDHMLAGDRPLSGVTGPRSSRATIQAASPESGIARSGRRGPLPR